MPERLEMHLLGGCTFYVDGKPISLATRAAEGIAVYVAHQMHPVTREQLMTLFFASSTAKQAAANMRRELSTIKKALGNYFAIDRVAIAARCELIWLDSAEFEHHNSPYSSGFLTGFFVRDAPAFEQWVADERERLRLIAISRLLKQMRELQSAGDWQRALQIADQLTTLEPLLEEAQQAKMLLLARTGQRALALKQYERVVDLFEEELGVLVSAATTQLHRRILRSSTPPTHNLPPSRTQFVGRTREMETLRHLLTTADDRLITLLGIGGIGKSRLAQQIGQQLIAESGRCFLDGIFFVELAAVQSADAFFRQLAATLSVTPNPRQPLRDHLQSWLHDRELLLILDNCEQLAQDRSVLDWINAVIDNAPFVKLLQTSRLRLGLHAETVIDLTGLPVPSEDEEMVERVPSVALFLNHARRQRRDIVVESAEIITTCQLLAGVPLALELAASWVRYLSLSEINARLQNSLAFLASNASDLPERQRSLQAVFDHSWQLLSEPVRVMLAQLSIFPDTFTTTAANAVVAATQQQIVTLVDHALLQLRNDGRLAIHPLIREFAQAQLSDRHALLLRHAAYFAPFLAERSTAHRPTYTRHFPQLTAENDNLLQAWQTTIDAVTRDHPPAWEWMAHMRLALRSYLLKRNWYTVLRDCYAGARLALEAAGWHEQPIHSRQRLLHAQLTSTELLGRWVLGDGDGVMGSAENLLPTLRHHDAAKEIVDVLNMLAQLHLHSGDRERVPALLHALKTACEAVDEPAYQSTYFMSHSFYEDVQGNQAASLDLALQALAIIEPLEDARYQARILESSARRMYQLGRTEEALATIRQAGDLALQDDAQLEWALARAELGKLYQMEGYLDEAVRCFEESLPVVQVHGYLNGEIEFSLAWARTLLAQADEGNAVDWRTVRRLLRGAIRQAQDSANAEMVDDGVALYGRYLAHVGQENSATLREIL